MSEPTSKAIRKARREVREHQRRWLLMLTGAVTAFAVIVALVWFGITRGGFAVWYAVAVTGIFVGGGGAALTLQCLEVWASLDEARDSLADAMDDERARLTREAERELLAFERRQGEDR